MRIVFNISVLGMMMALMPLAAYAQVDTTDVDEMVRRGDAFYNRQSYDSSLVEFQSALAWLRKNKLLANSRTTIIYNYIGDIYNKKKDDSNAHQYYTLALKTSRLLGIRSEKEKALTSLMSLHQDINTRDREFSYPPVAETEEAEVFFPVGRIVHVGDSLEVTMLAGKLDGLVDSVDVAELYTHITPLDTVHHNEIGYYGTARVMSVGNNHTILRIRDHAEIPLMPGDFAAVKTRVPLSWRKLSLRKFLLSALYLQDNYRLPHYHFRYFYYYTDSLLEQDVLGAMKSSVSEIVEFFGNDTITVEGYANKNEAGIFTGENVIHAMARTEPSHIRLFLDFVNRFPGKYIGNNYKFSDTYATWVISNTPLDPTDIKPWLLGLPNRGERNSQAFNLRKDIQENTLIDSWLDEGMQQVNVENIRDATQTAALVSDVSSVIGDRYNEGWGDYLYAQVERNLSRDNRADSFLRSAEQKFSAASNKEGIDWVANTRQFWSKGDTIKVAVQNGHLLPYVIAQSKNPRYFATGSADHLVKIWDRTLGKEILTLNDHQDEINSLHYSPNGRYLVSASEDSTICVWNAYTYTLLYKYHTAKPERVAIFSPDNRYIVSAGKDSLIKFRELQTGLVKKTLRYHKGTVTDLAFHPQYPFILYSTGLDSMIYKWDIDTEDWKHWYRQKGKVLSVKLSNDGNYMSVVSTDSLVTVWNTVTDKKMIWGKVHVSSPGTEVYYASETFSPDSKFISFPFARDSFLVLRMQDLYQRVYSTNEPKRNLCDLQFTDDGLALLARFDLGGPLRIYNFAGWDIRNTPTISWRDIRPYANIPSSVQFTKDDNALIVLHSEISKLDLRSGTNERLFFGYSLLENPYLLLDDENIGTYIDNRKPILYFYDYRKMEVVQQFALPDTQRLRCWELSPGSAYCFLGTSQGMIGGWDIAQKKQLFVATYTSGADSAIRGMRFDKTRGRLFAVTGEGKILVINAATGELINTLIEEDANYLVCSPQFIYFTTEDGWLCKLDAVTLKSVNKIKVNEKGEPAYYLAISDDHRYLALQNKLSSLMTLQLDNDSILYVIPDHDFGGTLLAISHDGNRIASAGFDSKVNLYDTKTGQPVVSIHYPLDKNVMISDPEGHYLAARNTLDAIMFTYNNNAYSYDQFDVQLNRPDIILAKIGRADTALVQAYHSAYKKRLSRMRIDEKNIGREMHLPLVRLQDRFAVQPVTTNKEFELTLECSDSRYPLQSIQVLVNNSPLLGVSGMDLRSLKTQYYVHKLKIPLSSGNNNIKVFCTNTKGAVSLQESFSIISKYPLEKPARTYFIGIGVASYKDSRMNLQYSVKDIRDLAKTFTNLYEDITVDTLIDSKVTRENILALKKKLAQTTVNDRVILAVTGHGLLSDSLDFYFATWDIDFNRPEKKGLRYDDLENLLTGIPARQKLMLIDACHSGALDKEELIALNNDSLPGSNINNAEPGVKGIAPRGFGLKNKAAKMSANSSFELMQNLFTDLSGSNGAVIISAAGGMEYAFESANWNNGVFTYCVRKGIENKAADLESGNFDGKVSVLELQTYVSRKVSELTGGKQKPTSRRENIDYEWMLRN